VAAPADIKDSILDTVGDTPLVRLSRIAAGLTPQVVAKVEYFNPGVDLRDDRGVEDGGGREQVRRERRERHAGRHVTAQAQPHEHRHAEVGQDRGKAQQNEQRDGALLIQAREERAIDAAHGAQHVQVAGRILALARRRRRGSVDVVDRVEALHGEDATPRLKDDVVVRVRNRQEEPADREAQDQQPPERTSGSRRRRRHGASAGR
jgi:hypothetical protein